MKSLFSLTAVLCLFLSLATNASAELTADQQQGVSEWLATPAAERPPIASLDLPANLSQAEAEQVKEQLWKLVCESQGPQQMLLGELPPELGNLRGGDQPKITQGTLSLGKYNMPFIVLRREQNPAPKSGRALFLCLHGGGQNAKANRAPRLAHQHAGMANPSKFSGPSLSVGRYLLDTSHGRRPTGTLVAPT